MKKSLFILYCFICPLISGCLFVKPDIFLNEYMQKNNKIIYDEDIDYPDWIELFNNSNFSVQLKGYRLADSVNKSINWKFPDVVLKSKSYLVVFASGKDRSFKNKKTGQTYIHTNFTIGNIAGQLVLTNPGGNIIDQVNTSKSVFNKSVSKVQEETETSWKVLEYSTPGFENNKYGYDKFIKKRESERSSVYINEIQASNRTTLINDEGDFTDWIELYNSSDENIFLQGYGLSNNMLSSNMEESLKWIFPDVVILPGQYMIIFASGKNNAENYNTYLHTNFKIDANKATVVLFNPDGYIIDKVAIKNQDDDLSWGRNLLDESEWISFKWPTPGYKNDSKEYYSLFINNDHTGYYGIYISEVLPSGYDKKKDEDYQVSDVIEIHNKNTFTVNLKGYYLSDDPFDIYKWKFPNIILGPDKYLYVYASGKDRYKGNIHTNFKIGSNDEYILLSYKPLGVIDKVPVMKVPFGTSYGRTKKDYSIVYFSDPTPGKQNFTGYMGFSDEVMSSIEGGYFDEPQYVKLSGLVDSIYYTLDGSEPDSQSHKYISPVIIDKTVVLRARGFTKGYMPGEIVTYTFLFNTNHDIPVISLVTDPYNLWDSSYGMLSDKNIRKKIERPVHIEYFEVDGNKGFSLNCGFRLFGHSSRLINQRPFYIITRKRYGRRVINYRLFPDKDLCIFKSFMLRNGGEDGMYSRIRDSLTSTLVRELGVDAQASAPVVVYLNGEYWGQYYIRDKIDEYYIAYNHNIGNPDNIDLIEGNGNVMSGVYTAFGEIWDYLKSHDMRKKEVYNYVKTQIDFDNLIDYEIAQIYFANTDMGNIRCWRQRFPKGRWRWILFDTDWSLYIFERDSFKWNLDRRGRGYLNYFTTIFINSLLNNEQLKRKFIKRFYYLLNTTFSKEHVTSVIDRLVGNIENEMPAHFERWGESIENWRKCVEWVRKFVKQRPEYLYTHLKNYFKLSYEELIELTKR